jgi:hypothetical protein
VTTAHKSRKSRAARSRTVRTRKTLPYKSRGKAANSTSRKPDPHKAQTAGTNHAIEPADPFTRAAITATRLEEDVANTVAQVSVAAIDTVERMVRFLFRMPKFARDKTRGKLLRWKAPDVRRSAERARESLAAVLPFVA